MRVGEVLQHGVVVIRECGVRVAGRGGEGMRGREVPAKARRIRQPCGGSGGGGGGGGDGGEEA